MMKKLMLSICTVAMTGYAAMAQLPRVCATDEFHRAQLAQHPEIAIEEARLKADIDRYINGQLSAQKIRWGKTAFDPADEFKTWVDDTAQYHVPVVVHIIYDDFTGNGAAVNITDADINGMMQRVNLYYNEQDPALPGILNNWKPYIGNANITFHLAKKDPQGNPTRGILREYSYTSTRGDESAKISQWPPNQYLNIYLINVIGRAADVGTVLAYATFPTSYSENPYSQGVISRADQATATSGGTEYTIAHEIGHFLSLQHPWANNGKAVEDTVCGDDGVDDTPPTVGHFSCGPTKLYDTKCAIGYYKDYDSLTFYNMTGMRRILAAVSTTNTSTILYNDSAGNRIGQSFITGEPSVLLQNITVRTAPGTNNGGAVRMGIYNAAGTTLLATSYNSLAIKADTFLVFDFSGVRLTGNTTYRFMIDSIPGSGRRAFRLRTDDSNRYAGGTMYVGNTAVPSTDLQFYIAQQYRIDYPDTTNTQNIMDYSSCPNEMFTRGQVARMRSTLRSDVGYRNNLISNSNLHRTGVIDTLTGEALPAPDVRPTALFTVSRYFTCANDNLPVNFVNRSYNGPVSGVSWDFGPNATNPTSTGTGTVGNTFTQPGWVEVKLVATSATTGNDTFTRTKAVYVADPTPVARDVEEFNPGPSVERFPIFNYFNHPWYKWELTNGAGYYDKTAIKFHNYDMRNMASVNNGDAVNTAVMSPRGLYADFITPAYDLSGFGGNCFLDFLSAGAYRTAKPRDMNDTLQISYTTNCGSSWVPMGTVTRGNLANNGLRLEQFTPTWSGEWKEQSLNVPTAARSNQVYFRFRYMPGTDNAYFRTNGLDFGTGNHFYIDRVMVTEFPLSVKNGVIVKLGMSIQPNPTSGAAIVRLNGGDNSTAEINVTDVTGKLVYRTSVVRSSATTEVEIPASVLSVKGMYLVQVVTNGATETQKLVAY